MAIFQQPVNYSADNVRELRSRTKMSRRQLVDRLADYGISLQQTSLRRIEEGQQSVKIEEAQAFAAIFKMPLEDFITKPVDPVDAELQSYLEMLNGTAKQCADYAVTFILTRYDVLQFLESDNIPPAEQSDLVREIVDRHAELEDFAKACLPLGLFPTVQPEMIEGMDKSAFESRLIELIESRYGTR